MYIIYSCRKKRGLLFVMVLPLAILKFEYIGSRLESVVKVIWYTDQNCILLKRNNRGYFWILHGRLIFNVLLITIVLRTLKLLKWRWNNWFLKNIYIRVKVLINVPMSKYFWCQLKELPFNAKNEVNSPKPWRVLIPSFQILSSSFRLLPISPFNSLLPWPILSQIFS